MTPKTRKMNPEYPNKKQVVLILEQYYPQFAARRSPGQRQRPPGLDAPRPPLLPPASPLQAEVEFPPPAKESQECFFLIIE